MSETKTDELKKRWRKLFYKHHRVKNPVFAGKSDLKSAFQILGLSPACFKWLVMKARDPATGIWYIFMDKCLPFGASISCSHFQRFSNALCYLTEEKIGEKKRITNYLDDFLFIARTLFKCNWMIQTFLELCKDLGVPVSMDKTEWATQLIVFLGILLDGEHFVLSIPTEKRLITISLLKEMMNKRKATVKDLQKLCGYLNFLGKAIFLGRTFTRRMYSKYSLIVDQGKHHNRYLTTNDYKLKQYHHVRLDEEFKLDCTVWLEFLNEEEHITKMVCRPMVDLLESKISAEEIFFFSDASAAPHLGFGALLKSKWIRADWTPDFINMNKPSIEYLELFALCAGVITWAAEHEMTNS